MKKRRSDSVLDNMPTHQQEALERWLFEETPRLTYAQAKERLWQDFGVRCSLSSLCAWYGRRAQDRTLSRIAQSAQESRSVVEAFRKNHDQAFDALMALIGQAAFEMKLKGGELSLKTLGDLTDIAALGLKAKTDALKLAQKERQIEQQDRKIALLEKKAAQADAARGLLENGQLTRAQREARMREIFGITG